MAKVHKIAMKKEKDCKGSVKYSTDDPKAVVNNAYVSREAFDDMPEAVVMTIEAGTINAKKAPKGEENDD